MDWKHPEKLINFDDHLRKSKLYHEHTYMIIIKIGNAKFPSKLNPWLSTRTLLDKLYLYKVEIIQTETSLKQWEKINGNFFTIFYRNPCGIRDTEGLKVLVFLIVLL